MTALSTRFLRGSRTLAAFVLLTAHLVAPAAVAQEFDLACPADEELRVIELINQERAARGLAALTLDVRLGASALRHSEDMANGCFLSHTGSDGTHPANRVLDAGYLYYGGEVAGAGQRTAETIVDGWMNSPGHYAIIMGSGPRHIGVAHVSRSACRLQGYTFNVSDFWTANVGYDPAPPFGEAEHCDDGAPVDDRPCDDGVDNDGDGLVDLQEDWGCTGPDDLSEQPACSDGIDNDGDGRIDFGDDAGCMDAIGYAEDPPCQDGLDNDGDGLTDYPDDPGCVDAAQLSENDVNCGLGAELALLLPPLLWLRRRRA